VNHSSDAVEVVAYGVSEAPIFTARQTVFPGWSRGPARTTLRLLVADRIPPLIATPASRLHAQTFYA
jgi:hypothetical protein